LFKLNLVEVTCDYPPGNSSEGGTAVVLAKETGAFFLVTLVFMNVSPALFLQSLEYALRTRMPIAIDLEKTVVIFLFILIIK
jgi:hypothetical protein